MSGAIDLLLLLCALPVFLASGYLFVLTLLSGRLRAPGAAEPATVFDVIVPAHDEEAGIADTVKSLSGMDYPANLRRIVVVADNCTDATAERAREAGATVLLRTDTEKRGKGYALEYAFERTLSEGKAHAVVVVDADTEVSPNLLRAFAARIALGADAVQAEYGVRNSGASWRTRLMRIAFSLFHAVRSLARERMKVSCGLRGNGMCFTTGLLRRVPHHAYSLVEDLEYGIRLGEAGVRVWFAHEAEVLGEMVAGEKGSRSQRRRWEGGRFAIARAHGGRLVREAIQRRSLVLLDLAFDVWVPPLSWIALAAVGGMAVSAVLSWWTGALFASVTPFAACVVFLGGYVLRGWWLSGTGVGGLFDLACAPAYVVWKLVLALKRDQRQKGEWVRTARNGEAP